MPRYVDSVVPRLLLNSQRTLAGSPAAFLAASAASMAPLFLSAHDLTYRPRLRVWLRKQPVLLALNVPHVLAGCRAAARSAPALACAAFGPPFRAARLLATGAGAGVVAAVGGAGAVRAGECAGPVGARLACTAVSLFALAAIGLAPGLRLARLEAHAWGDFLRHDAAALTWPGGPPLRHLDAALRRARAKRAAERAAPRADAWRTWAVAILLSASLWRLIELAL